MTDEEDADDLTQRERRAERHKKAEPGAWAGKAMKGAVGYLVILAIAGGAIGMTYLGSRDEDPECPQNDYSHYHPAFMLFVNGTRVPFTRQSAPQAYELPGGVPFHIHADDGIMHVEPFSNSCVEFKQVLGKLGIDASADRLVLEANPPAPAGTYNVDPAHNLTLQAFHKKIGGSWNPLSVGSLNNRVLHLGESVLLTYGDLNETAIAAQQAQVPAGQEPLPDSKFPTVPIIGITGVAIVALVIWRGFVKKA